jgi:hypothetical protein
MKLEDLETKLGIADLGEEEKLALVKEIQANIPALKAEQRVLEAKTQANLVVEAIKKIKEGLEARFDELNGIVDVKVRDITAGKDGLDGKDGKNGKDGKDGINGVSITGPRGEDGEDGVDGVGVADARIDFDGSLVIVLTNGKEINAGDVVPLNVTEKLKIVKSTSGTANSVLEAIEAINTAIVSYGTMATQNANAVAITGGTINGATVGGTTPAAGTFTTLSASSTVSGTGFSTYLASPPAIGATTPATGTFTTLIGGGDSANYGQLTGGATTKAVEFKSLGSDTNVAYAIRSKGTGAIDLAAGSSGVNISNGGTVTAITRTAAGSGYTSFPSVAISAPTTAGGVQATASFLLATVGATIVSGGTGYTAGDVLTVTGGTTGSTQLTVSTVSSGVITAVTITLNAGYSAIPTNPVSVTGGTGSGATFNLTYGIANASFTITNAGSGYVEQPTVTFSGGGGSGAAAYATVGSGTVIKSIGSTMSFATAAGESLRLTDGGSGSQASYENLVTTTGTIQYLAAGSNTTVQKQYITKGAVNHNFATNTVSTNVQFVVSHTASAVNYLQVTGAATNNALEISSQGSDASVSMQYSAKNAGNHIFRQAGGTNFRVNYSVITAVNNLAVTGSLAGSSPSLFSQGTDTDVSLSLVPKGLGIVLMNQQTPTAVTATGTLTIANLLTQIITSTSATAVALTLPTGTLSDAGVSGGTSAVNTSFDWSIINTGSAVGDVTLVAGTAHTIVGSATVAVGTSGKFRSRKTATNTFVTYRV